MGSDFVCSLVGVNEKELLLFMVERKKKLRRDSYVKWMRDLRLLIRVRNLPKEVE
jgi:hypothetical protein